MIKERIQNWKGKWPFIQFPLISASVKFFTHVNKWLTVGSYFTHLHTLEFIVIYPVAVIQFLFKALGGYQCGFHHNKSTVDQLIQQIIREKWAYSCNGLEH
jgi:hypothetical protein